MTPAQNAILIEIRQLLDDAYRDYFARDEDGHHKSSEGYIEVFYPNFFEREQFRFNEASGIGIYSYVLGPSRMHYWFYGRREGDSATKYSNDPFVSALSDVRKWHKAQIEWTPDDD